MIKLDLDNVIDNKDEDWMFFWDGERHVFSVDTVKKVIEANPDEKEMTINIHAKGGSTSEGFTIYDYLRNSGLKIFTNIEGECHSMATVILLAAPKENRTANKNCSSIIHKVRGGVCGYMTADEFDAMAESVRQDEQKILNIYADRTDLNKEELEVIMKEEKSRTAEELLSWGFISKINIPNTNKVTNNKQKTEINMNQKIKDLLEKANSITSSINKLINPTVNYVFNDANGSELFTTEKAEDDDTLAVGDAASPDGTFTLATATSEYPEGTVIVITSGVIESITEPEAATNEDEVKAENAALKLQNENLTKAVKDSLDIINSMKAEIETKHVPLGRITNPPKQEGKKETINLDEVKKGLKSNKTIIK